MSEIIGSATTWIAALVIIVNIITEVAKKVSPILNSSKSINIFVLILSVVVTAISGSIYFVINKMPIEWYYIPVMVIIGIFVAYAAMFGYDKLLVYLEDLKNGNS